MAYPPNFDRSHDFLQDEIDGRATLDGNAVNSNLDAVSATANSLNDNLKRIQRSDGALASNIVGEDQMRAGLFDDLIQEINDGVQLSVDEAKAWAEASQQSALNSALSAAASAVSADSAGSSQGQAAVSALQALASEQSAQASAAVASDGATKSTNSSNKSAGHAAEATLSEFQAMQWAELLAGPVMPQDPANPTPIPPGSAQDWVEAVDDGHWSARWWAWWLSKRWADNAGPAGPPGEDGEQGEDGDPGPPGENGGGLTLIGTATVAEMNARDPLTLDPGDSWLLTDAGTITSGTIPVDVLIDDLVGSGESGEWVNFGNFTVLPGPAGPPGADGADGADGAQGIPGIPGADGADSTVPGPEGPQGEKGDPGSGGGGRTESPILQVGHGFGVMDVIRWDGVAWVKALADDVNTTALGLVVSVEDVDNFTFAMSGRYAIGAHLPDTWYYLSDTTPGALVEVEPAISQPIVYSEDGITIIIFPYRPSVGGAAGGTPGDGVEEAPQDGTPYEREDGEWVPATPGAVGPTGPAGADGADSTVPGPPGADGLDGVVATVVGGTDISVDATDPANPIVNYTGTGGGGGSIVGEIKAFVGDPLTLPAGWFVADGLNGTLNLQGLTLFGAGGNGILPSTPIGAMPVGGTAGLGGAHGHVITVNAGGAHSHGGTSSTEAGHTHPGAGGVTGSDGDVPAGTSGTLELTMGHMPSNLSDNLKISLAAAGQSDDHSTTASVARGAAANGAPAVNATLVTASNATGVAHGHTIPAIPAHTHTVPAGSTGVGSAHGHSVSTDEALDHGHTGSAAGAADHQHSTPAGTLPPGMGIYWIQYVGVVV